MRTTVTLDPDAERILREAMRQTGQSFKVTLNQAIRRGLSDTLPELDEPPFTVEAQDMGVLPGVDLANIHDLESELEVEGYLEVTRALERRQVGPKSSSGGSSS